MIEPIIVVTNNPMCREKLADKYKIDFINGTTVDVLERVRDYIHGKHILLTHPLVSGIKPNEIPYRTIIITKRAGNTVDIKSLNYIERGILTTEKFLKNHGISHWSKKILDDFSLIDYDLVKYNL
ncbi:GrdX family protein [Clostridium sp. MT-14]|uniref:GrdX family protein n=1 Tax=Clostridium sp. MT-14 TaxID=3348360 RepID=UPI0035F3AD84